METKDLCKTCENYWEDFSLPLEYVVSHCEIVDKKNFNKFMNDIVPYPCLECPFNCYKKKQ